MTFLVRSHVILLLMVVAAVFMFSAAALAADTEGIDHATDETVGSGLRIAGLAFAAAFSIGVAGLATAKVQSMVAAGGLGAMAEKPELFTSVLILYAIPETVVVLGFVVAVLILGNI